MLQQPWTKVNNRVDKAAVRGNAETKNPKKNHFATLSEVSTKH